ncbi:MAG: hypothetical protein ACRDUV_20405 [Pseudonocardiaceae bacterium]
MFDKIGLADFVCARDLSCRNPICGQHAATAHPPLGDDPPPF